MNCKKYLDNIIFSLQKSGGISAVWQELISQINRTYANDACFRCIEYDGALSNYFRRQICLPADKIDLRSSSLLGIKRYLNPHIVQSEPFIFHSSYYRVSGNRFAKNITTVHDFTYEYYMRGIRKKIHSWQKFSAILRSDEIVCVSENTKRDLLKFLPNIDVRKIHVIYNGVSEVYKRLDRSPYSSLGDFVLFVGSRAGYKNFVFLVEAMKEIKMKLVIVGRNLSEQETSLLDSKVGRDRYFVFSNATNEELNEIYNAAFCLVYPSSYEGFGIPVLEAQRAGCPVIAMDASSIPEVIGQTSLLLKRLDVMELKKMYSLLGNAKMREEIIDAGYKNSLRFSWERMGKEYMKLYDSLMDKY